MQNPCRSARRVPGNPKASRELASVTVDEIPHAPEVSITTKCLMSSTICSFRGGGSLQVATGETPVMISDWHALCNLSIC